MSSPATPTPKADLIVLSSNVLTLDDSSDAGRVRGVAIAEGKILELVGEAGIESLRGPNTVVHDVGARRLLPGFVDVHAHTEVACRSAHGTVDCRAPECAKVDDVLEALSQASREKARGDWVVGQANLFFDRKLEEGRLPTRDELDGVSRSVPIALRAGGHITVLNTKALELAGIDDDFVPPSSSVTGKPVVVRDECGCATGVVKEMDNLLPIPAPDETSLRSALKTGIHKLFTEHGVTSIGEISETIAGIESMDHLAAEGELDARVSVYLWAPGTMTLEQACDWPSHVRLNASEDMLSIQGVKLFADGGYSAKSAAVKQPYIGEHGHCGDIALSEDYMRQALAETRRAGLQLAIHANGDRAQEWLCDVIAANGGAPAGRMRTRIEHAGNFRPERETTDSWRRAGIIPVPQPVFLYTFGDYFADYLGDYGNTGRFPFAELLADGWRLSGSSDVWVGSEREATNPLFGVWCAVKRESYTGTVIDPDQRVTVEQALRMHTVDAAAVMGLDTTRGSLAPGKVADLVVLSRDPMTVPVDDIPSIAVDAVYLGGSIRFQRGEALAGGALP
jgi:predicted amidohydrolase YtcJ